MVLVALVAVLAVSVLVPPALRAHEARCDAFIVSLGRDDGSDVGVRRRRSPVVERRRGILTSLLVAMVGTGVIGLLPTFRTLLIVHLFLVDGFLGYVAVLARLGDLRRRRRAAPAESPAPDEPVELPEPLPLPTPRIRRRAAFSADLPPVAAAG